MIALLLIVLPLAVAALGCYLGKYMRVVRFLFLGTAAAHTLMTCSVLLLPEHPFFSFSVGGAELLGFDSLSIIFLTITTILFLLVAVHTHFWLPAEFAAESEHAAAHGKPAAGFWSENLFRSALLAFLAMMTLVIASRNLGVLWIALEATTLVSAPLICFRRSAGSLEAMWKYLLICSVGIGMALFGTMLLDVAAAVPGREGPGLNIDRLLEVSESFHPGWFKAAFIFALAGYGAKMGLAPFHTWLPDAHSEAPGTVSALLSGALLNCSFLALLRFYDLAPMSLRGFCSDLLVALGLLSLAVAAFFIVGQNDFKRMLAYSSVEHMGLIAILWGIGAEGAALFHACGHSLIKMLLFLVAGNILLAYGTRSIPMIGGMFRKLPRNAFLWVAGILLICGTPPSPLFVTEFVLIRDASPLLAASVLLLLFIVFAGMARCALRMSMGDEGAVKPVPALFHKAERLDLIPLTALAGVVVFGVFLILLLNHGGI